MTDLRKYWNYMLAILGLGIFWADITFKGFVFRYIDIQPVFQWGWLDLYIQCVTNRGVAWGLFNDFPWVVFMLRLIIVFLLVGYYFHHRRNRAMSFCTMLILVGACGNIFDFLYYGYVIDMFHFLFFGQSYGIFNISDVCIFVGAIGLILVASHNEGKSRKKASARTNNE